MERGLITKSRMEASIQSVLHGWIKKHGMEAILPSLDAEFMERMVQSSRDNMTEEEIISLLSFVAGSLASHDPKWDFFAADVLMGLHQDASPSSFLEVVRILQTNEDVSGKNRPLLEDSFVSWIDENQEWIESMFQEEVTATKSFPITLFGWKTLYKSYLMRSNGKVVERPDHMWFRVALFLHRDHKDLVLRCFQDLRSGRYTHATPTLYYAGARRPQMASCFPWNAVVYTPDGGRPISRLSEGDLVLTHTGGWKKIQQVHHDVVGHQRCMVQIRAHGTVVDATSDHPFLMTSGEFTAPEDPKFNVKELFRVTPSFFGESLLENDTVCLSRLAVFCDSVDSTDGIEKQWSRDFPSRIPALLQKAILSDPHTTLKSWRERWRVHESTYLNMWYEQWFVGIAWEHRDPPTLDDAQMEVFAESQPTEKVYTLTVEDDHSYVVNGLVAKNCFLVGTEDSIEGIFKTISDVAQISKWAGGLGVHISNIRADRSYIYGTNGYSNGLLPMIRLYNDTSRYIDQCFSPETWIWTKSVGWKEMAEITVGDCVLTASGTYAEVDRILSHVLPEDHSDHPQKMIQIEGWRGRKTSVTAGHDFLVGRNSPQEEDDYVPVGEISSNDVVRMQRPCWVRGSGGEVGGWTRQWAHLLALVVGNARYITMSCPTVWKVEDPKTLKKIKEVLGGEDGTMAEVDKEKDGMIRWKIGLFPWAWGSNGRTIRPPYEWLHMGIKKEKEEQMIRVFLDTLDSGRTLDDPLWERFYASLVYRWESEEVWVKKCGWKAWGQWSRVETGSGHGNILYDLEVRGEDRSYTTEIGTVHNGGGKRNGAFAMYLEPWHADIMAFLAAKKNTGPEEDRARDLFYGLWIPDLLMERVEANKTWSLMCPRECPGLSDVHGKEFVELYEKYEAAGKFRRQMSARELFTEILKCQIETGTPYILYKDSCNRKSNQKHLGTIKSSNLCVRGDTMMLTREGYISMTQCVGSALEVWNGVQFSEVVPLETQSLVAPGEWLRIITTRGKRLESTRDHVFFVGPQRKKVTASQLQPGMRLTSWILPSLETLSSEVIEEIERACRYLYHHAVIMEEKTRVMYAKDYESLMQLQILLELGNIMVSVHAVAVNRWRMDVLSCEWDSVVDVVNGMGILTKTTGPTRIVEEIESITPILLPNPVPSFCIREAQLHSAVFQGILAGQCTEIIEYSDASQYAVCNLASISLPACLKPNTREPPTTIKVHPQAEKDVQWVLGRWRIHRETVNGNDIQKTDTVSRDIVVVDNDRELTPHQFFNEYISPVMDLGELYRLTREVTVNLNEVIDKNRYPTPETRVSNLMHRPVGIGVQGLADVFCALKMPFDSIQARQLNHQIFETIYHAALSASCDSAMVQGAYESYPGSPLSKGQFHWELCAPAVPPFPLLHNWEALREKIREHGTRNSLLIAPMPTASTSQILGNNECFEPYTSNFYTRRTQAGEFLVYNRELYKDLCALDGWTPETRQELLWNRGSVKNITILPDWLRRVYLTVWEIPQKSVLDLAIDRHFFIDQSQSMNLFLAEPSLEVLIKMHLYGFHKGLKTGSYYIRSRPPLNTPHFSMQAAPAATDGPVCPLRRPGSSTTEECEACMG